MQQQQQVSQQEQYGNPQQMPQQMMLCPIQYVYESPMLVPQQPQPQEEQQPAMQQNQLVFNIQNTPPWIQNRAQNQVVYVQQLPNMYQSYVQTQMVQTPNGLQQIYQPQLNYIQQPMIQDTRFMQIPNLTQYNTAQNQPAQITPQITNEEADRMPMLTQMLSQKPVVNNIRPSNVQIVNNTTAANVNKATATINNIRPIAPIANVRAPNVNMIRPMMQNQQVQTDISANNKARQKNAPPQIITINPLQQRQYINQPQDVMLNITRPQTQFVRDVPQHIRSKIPSSISVKTVFRHFNPRPAIRPYDVVPQNVYYSPNFVSMPQEIRHNVAPTNSYGNQNYINQNQGQVNVQGQNVPTGLEGPIPKVQNEIAPKKQTVDASVTANVKLDLNQSGNTTQSDKTISAKVKTQIEEKLMRNTVYVQARGRILSENETQNNLKRTVENRLQDNKSAATEIYQDASSNKYIKIELAENAQSTTDKMPANSNNTLDTKPKIENLHENLNNSNNKPQPLHMPEINTVVPMSVANQIGTAETTVSKDSQNCKDIKKEAVNKDLEQEITANIIAAIDTKQISAENEVIDSTPHINSSVNKDIDIKHFQPKKRDLSILTHVLDGYIIQESNVAFPIHKPLQEQPNAQFDDKNEDNNIDKNNVNVNKDNTNTTNTSNKKESCEVKHDRPQESDKEADLSRVKTEAIEADNRKDDPFANVQKSTVESWTTEELASHLAKHEWLETAAKLQDEEIDGESLLLVNKDQLVAIGVSEKHAEIITAFSTGR